MPIRFLIIFTVFFAQTASYGQQSYYVSTSGNDSFSGTAAMPWRSVQYGIDQLSAGDTLYVTEGRYNEKLYFNAQGTKEKPIVFKAKGKAIIDGTGLRGQNGLLTIENRSNIVIDGLEFTNNVQNYAQGILITGGCENITVKNNRIHEIHFSDNPEDKVNIRTNAYGILVYGTDSDTAVSNLVIQNNQLYNCRLGYSEGIAVNGNVDGFEISQNKVFNLTNIGIDAIGGEGTCKDVKKDHARNGRIAGNLVYNCVSEYATSAGIYVDGGKNIEIINNTSIDNGYGIEIGAENIGVLTENIRVKDNFIHNNQMAGIAVGGFDYPNTGKVVNCTISDNVLKNNASHKDGMAELYLSYTEKCHINNNIIEPSSSYTAIYAQFEPVQLIMDNNRYYSKAQDGSIGFSWQKKQYNSLTEFTNATGLGKNSTSHRR